MEAPLLDLRDCYAFFQLFVGIFVMPKFQLERSIAIQASAASVFSIVRDFSNWPVWSPWILAEPRCKIVYADDEKGYGWDGDIVGSGEMELLDFVENEELRYRLTFFTPWKSTSLVSFRFEECKGSTDTYWTMDGSLPFFLFWMKKTMLAAIGMDFDRGLRMLKDRIELGRVPSELRFGGLETVGGSDYVGVRTTCSLSDISERMPADLEKVSSKLKGAGIAVAGPPVCFYDRFDIAKGVTTYTIGLPTKGKAPAGLVARRLPSLKAYAIHHRGPYRHVGNPWAAGMMHSRAKLFARSKKNVPFEVYENDPKTVSEEEIRTAVYFPIR